MPFKILKNAGYAPPEVELFKERAELAAALAQCNDAQEQRELQSRLSALQQRLALRLEALKTHGNL